MKKSIALFVLLYYTIAKSQTIDSTGYYTQMNNIWLLHADEQHLVITRR
jgi:hypothetical protein